LVAAPVAIALVGAGLLAYRAVTSRPDVTVPAAVGQGLFPGIAALRDAGFEVEAVTRRSPQPAGTILAQRPRPGRQIPEGDTVRITVSDIQAEMPDVIGLDEADGAAALRDVGLATVVFADEFTGAEAPGTIIRTDPLAHQNALKADTITLTIARDPSVVIPEVRFLDEATARARLEEIGLVVGVQPATSRTVPAGGVISVSPGVGAGATRGDSVSIKVSSGPRLVPVPNVVTDDAEDAVDELEDDGFAVRTVAAAATGGDVGKVLAQDPIGVQVPEGATVTITVGVRAR
jgi:serine/threonine-protein kinase